MIQKKLSIQNNTAFEKLFLEIDEQHLSFFSCDVDGKINGLEIFSFSKTDKIENIFSEMNKQSFLWKNNADELFVVCRNAYVCCVPKELYNEEQTEFYRDLLNAPLATQDYIANFSEFYVKYFTDEKVINLLKKNFSSLRITHKYSTIIKRAEKISTNKENKIYTVFYDKKIIVALLNAERFLLINTFDFATGNDVVYHLLNVAQKFEFELSESVLFVSGEIEESSSLFNQLKNYFPKIEIDLEEELISKTENFSEFSAQYFTPFISNIEYFTT